MDLRMIEETIIDLENAETTFENCSKLADLYYIRETAKKENKDATEHEINDILPAYQYYVDIKRNYQLNMADEDAMLNAMSIVCNEIYDLFRSLYSDTNTPKERKLISNLIENLKNFS